ncbi:MAG: hypothetical protein ACREFI_14045 [Stellaceae bacterium]
MTESIVYRSTATGLWEEAAASLGEPEVGLEDAIDSRMAFLTEWLQENTPCSHEGLAGLDSATREQIFWHHGYLVALRSVRSFMQRRRHVLN